MAIETTFPGRSGITENHLCRLCRRDELVVILEEFPRRAAHFKRHLVGALHDGETVGCEG